MLLVAFGQVLASSIEWPPLPATGFIAGKAATQQDVESGKAVFAMESDGNAVAKPLRLAIPQYAYHLESGRKVPVIVVQAETNGDVSLIGFLSIRTNSYGVGLMEEFELLGRRKPR